MSRAFVAAIHSSSAPRSSASSVPPGPRAASPSPFGDGTGSSPARSTSDDDAGAVAPEGGAPPPLSLLGGGGGAGPPATPPMRPATMHATSTAEGPRRPTAP